MSTPARAVALISSGLFVSVLTACSDMPPPSEEHAEAPISSPTSSSLDFGPCPAGYQTECAKLEVPLDHRARGGETIVIHVARRRASVKATRQVWLLAGGPGQGGYVFNRKVSALAQRLPDADIYVIDHRGTGYSHRLTCSYQDVPGSSRGYVLDPAKAAPCLHELDAKGDLARLSYFTTTQAAYDVVRAVEATHEDGLRVYVWGASYGTHWAHRVLQVAPQLADGIVFDGFMTPSKFGFTQYDAGVDEAGRRFAAGCSSDTSCKSRMGGDALAKTRAVFDSLATKPCGRINRAAAQAVTAAWMAFPTTRMWIFPWIHRLERCSASDIVALENVLDTYKRSLSPAGAATGDSSPPAYLDSGILQYNIALSELWHVAGGPLPSKLDLLNRATQQTFFSGVSYPASIVDLRAFWPMPPNDYGDLPTPVTGSRTAMLWLASELDTRAPATQAEGVVGLYPSQSFVLLPGSGHTPSETSFMIGGGNCGDQIIDGFVSRDVVDASCRARIFPNLYEAPSAQIARYWWNDDDDWGDARPKPAASSEDETNRATRDVVLPPE